jgi:hypothetical protein
MQNTRKFWSAFQTKNGAGSRTRSRHGGLDGRAYRHHSEWAIMTLNTESFDYAPPGGSSYVPPKIENRQQTLAAFDKGVTETRKAIEGATDDDMTKVWSLLAGGQTVFALPRVAVFRSMIMNHLIHHRAQLTVYYRLLGVPVPGLYGPAPTKASPAPPRHKRAKL